MQVHEWVPWSGRWSNTYVPDVVGGGGLVDPPAPTPAAVRLGQGLKSGGFGRIGLPNVDAATPARHRYQAMAAAMRPRTPPIQVRAGLALSAPRPRRKKVTVTTANNRARPVVVRSAPTSMSVVKTVAPKTLLLRNSHM